MIRNLFNSLYSLVSRQMDTQVQTVEATAYNEDWPHLLEMDWTILEIILSHLAIRDLQVFCLTSKRSQQIVEEFIEHYMACHNRRKALQLFLENCQYCFLPYERRNFQLLSENPEGSTIRHYIAAKKFILGETWRFSVADCEDFPHLGSRYISKHWDNSLNRYIVELHSVCWLLFKKTLGFHPKGQYQVRLRIFVRSNIQWPLWGREEVPNFDTQLKVNKLTRSEDGTVSTRTTLVSEEISPEFWSSIGKCAFDNSLLQRCDVVQDVSDRYWNYIVFKPFSIGDESELEFEFSDVTNPNWKSGLKWDFIEIQQLPKTK